MYSIRDEDLKGGEPAAFTVKYFDETTTESVWHNASKGRYITECDGNKIQIEVEDWSP